MEFCSAKEKIIQKLWIDGAVRRKTKNVFVKHRNVVSQKEKIRVQVFTENLLAKRQEYIFAVTKAKMKKNILKDRKLHRISTLLIIIA